jgi:hypothetical protein
MYRCPPLLSTRKFLGLPDPYPGPTTILYNQAEVVRKALIPTGTVFLLLCDFLSLKNDVNVASKRNKKKKFEIFLPS